MIEVVFCSGLNLFFRRYNLERSFLKDCDSSVQETDLIGVVHDASNKWTREKLDIKIISLLERNVKKPSFLILNKVINDGKPFFVIFFTLF